MPTGLLRPAQLLLTQAPSKLNPGVRVYDADLVLDHQRTHALSAAVVMRMQRRRWRLCAALFDQSTRWSSIMSGCPRP